jgi:hypothetical protein
MSHKGRERQCMVDGSVSLSFVRWFRRQSGCTFFCERIKFANLGLIVAYEFLSFRRLAREQ